MTYTRRPALLACLLAAGCAADVKTGSQPGTAGGVAGRRGGGGGGGGDGGDGGAGGASSMTAATAPVVVTEIMYHPVLENGPVDRHEFVEIYNRSGVAVDLAGWKLGGDVMFTFPAGAKIAPKQFLVVAKDRAALAAVASYGLRVGDLLGDYTGQLDNGKGVVSLSDGAGAAVERVAYSDEFPWPLAADALGAGESWLSADNLPLDKHQFMGRSLARFNPDVAATEPANWDVSPLDGATPGKPNAGSANATMTAPDPPAIAETLVVIAKGAAPEKLISRADEVVVRVAFTAGRKLSALAIEWFVDDVAKTGEATVKVNLLPAGAAFEATLPARPENSIVRYRVVGDRGDGKGQVTISPRPSDPFTHHAYFVTPDRPGKAPAVHLFVSPDNWGKMWTNVQPDANSGRVLGCKLGALAVGAMPVGCPGSCMPNPNWNARVPAVFASDGKVYDVRVRYQGSKVNRLSGRRVVQWPTPTFAGPTAGPEIPGVLSWSVSFPRYRTFGGRDTLLLNKNSQACPGFANHVGMRLSEELGVPGPHVRYVRFFVNGAYYNYAIDIERTDEAMLRRFFPKQPIGDLFKNDGLRWDEGPWGWGDGRKLEPYCGYTPRRRYEFNYPRKTNDWGSHDELVKLVEDLADARAAGGDGLRKFLGDKFETDLVLKWIAVNNWVYTWDDAFHNYFLYKQAGGKWMILPWDFDSTLQPVDVKKSFYQGREGEPDNRNMIWNVLKDSFMRAYKAEYEALLKRLSTTLFAPEKIAAIIDEIAVRYDVDEAKAALGGVSCDVVKKGMENRQFAVDRAARFMEVLP